MKRHLLLSVAIVLVGFALHQHQEIRIRLLRQSLQHVSNEAIALGIRGGSAQVRVPSTTRVTTRPKRESSRVAREFLAQLADFFQQTRNHEASGEGPNPAETQSLAELMLTFSNMNASELSELTDQLSSSNPLDSLDPNLRRFISAMALDMLSTDHPELAWEGFKKHSGSILADPQQAGSESILQKLLCRLAARDPAAALAGMSEFQTNDPKSPAFWSVLGAIAEQDLVLALEHAGQAASEISKTELLERFADHAKSTQSRLNILQELRRSNAPETSLQRLITPLLSQGFDASSDWLRSAALTPPESETLQRCLKQQSIHMVDHDHWLAWLSSQPSANSPDTAATIMWWWTQADTRAAAAWLAVAPDGPIKAAAAQAHQKVLHSGSQNRNGGK